MGSGRMVLVSLFAGHRGDAGNREQTWGHSWGRSGWDVMGE